MGVHMCQRQQSLPHHFTFNERECSILYALWYSLCMRYTCTGSLSRMGTFASARSTASWMRSRSCW